MVGTGMGAKNGILIKGGAALEVASKVDAIVFDKTGTLTKGQPEVSDFVHLEVPVKKDSKRATKNATMADEDRQASQDYLLWLLGSLERNSEHPLGKAIVKYAQGQLGEAIMESNPFAEPTNFKAVTGRGAMGELLGKVTVAIGNRSFIKMLDLTVSATTESSMKELELQGKTAMMAVVDDVVVAVIGVADELKPDARAAITYLQSNLNAEVWMVTGDNAVTANSIRAQIGLAEDRVIAEALPATKLEKVKELQAAGKIVAMVGDGINDSPALAQADVGIGIGTGAEIAAEASDIVLVSGKSVFEVCVAFHMARAIYQRIIWNLVWSLAYNCIAIPVAAGALYPLTKTRLPPAVAAALMALSSISVVMGSLSLYLYKPPVCENQRINQEEENAHTRQAEDGEVNDCGDIENGLTANLLSNDHLGRPCYGSKQSLHLLDKTQCKGVEAMILG
jgi:P-type Cu+ transporter